MPGFGNSDELQVTPTPPRAHASPSSTAPAVGTPPCTPASQMIPRLPSIACTEAEAFEATPKQLEHSVTQSTIQYDLLRARTLQLGECDVEETMPNAVTVQSSPAETYCPDNQLGLMSPSPPEMLGTPAQQTSADTQQVEVVEEARHTTAAPARSEPGKAQATASGETAAQTPIEPSEAPATASSALDKTSPPSTHNAGPPTCLGGAPTPPPLGDATAPPQPLGDAPAPPPPADLGRKSKNKYADGTYWKPLGFTGVLHGSAMFIACLHAYTVTAFIMQSGVKAPT